jgi:hypothetical protein
MRGVTWMTGGAAETALTSELVLSALVPPRPVAAAATRGW